MNDQIRENALASSTRALRVRIRTTGLLALPLAGVLALAGCITSEPRTYPVVTMDETPERPKHVLVYDFAATTADITADAPIGARVSAAGSVSAAQNEKDRQLGSNMASQVIMAVREMGLPAERALPATPLQAGDLVIRGYLGSVYEGGGPIPRFTIGFDLRAAELAAVVESFQITSRGSGRKLYFDASTPAGNAADSTAGNTNTIPASAIPPGFIVTSRMKIDGEESYRTQVESWATKSVKEIAERLKPKFQEQGWIEK